MDSNKPNTKLKDDIANTQLAHRIFKTAPYWENTGGYVMVQCMEFQPEFVELLGLTGTAITVDDEGVAVYKKLDDFFDGESDFGQEYLQSNQIAEQSGREALACEVEEGVTSCLVSVNIRHSDDYQEQKTYIRFKSGYELVLEPTLAGINNAHELEYVVFL